MEPFATAFAAELAKGRAAAAACPAPMGGPGNLDLLYHLAWSSGARRVLETGVAYGWSTLALLLGMRERPDARLISIDMPYPQRGTDEYVGVVVPTELRGAWKLLPYPDRDGLPRALRLMPQLDMCHYDSDKAYEARTWAYSRLWNGLREGGHFISDDIDDDVGFRDFCASVNRDPVIVTSAAFTGLDAVRPDVKYVGVLIK